MTQRITQAHLKAKIATLNRMMGKPEQPYQDERDQDGRLVPNVGTFMLSGAYGGYSVHRMCQGGGAADVLSIGHVKARELADLLSAYMRGIYDGRNV